MPLNARTLTLILSSSGMRVGEALSLKVSEIDVDRNPVRINLKAANTKTKKKRITLESVRLRMSYWNGLHTETSTSQTMTASSHFRKTIMRKSGLGLAQKLDSINVMISEIIGIG